MNTSDGPLGDNTEKVLSAIRDHMRRHGYPPTIRELGKSTGVSSTAVITYHLRKLIKCGRIARPDFGASRAIVLPDAWVQFAGDEVLVEVDGEVVRGRVVEPVAKAA